MYIETTINSVKVTFYLQTSEANVAKNVAKNLTDRQQQIIALITDNPQTTRAEIACGDAQSIYVSIGQLQDVVDHQINAVYP